MRERGGGPGRGVGRGMGVRLRCVDHNNGRGDTKGVQVHQAVVNHRQRNLSRLLFDETLSILGKLHIVLE